MSDPHDTVRRSTRSGCIRRSLMLLPLARLVLSIFPLTVKAQDAPVTTTLDTRPELQWLLKLVNGQLENDIRRRVILLNVYLECLPYWTLGRYL